MAFGLTQWLILFTVFAVVLTAITWSAIHLVKKEPPPNITDIIYVFLDADYSIEWRKAALYTQFFNVTSRVVEKSSKLVKKGQDFVIPRTISPSETIHETTMSPPTFPTEFPNVTDNYKNYKQLVITPSPDQVLRHTQREHLTHKTTSFDIEIFMKIKYKSIYKSGMPMYREL
ncbi:PREDICTED: uncharacterized protein LOC108746274 [Trachymyrmex septentrionalis]|uniref:uncharacterized protein LOC108746274 n=1 Tax=Trachymyrmex septentrionalis TaxID=34720 RepID=UPI00084EFAED|nr:PREDICTED: uncharacterized protein LOC108746274 [Trachymyrmex septentrionalis]XP_018338451.1 PREDICTED: uncharacterized protein LOC108746274 [Trachymyrmex septentrionalis]XP_018338458.1 PREDICTED: uncharacterized protein LOC108746274 [Trachymyrmex septentrionalis]